MRATFDAVEAVPVGAFFPLTITKYGQMGEKGSAMREVSQFGQSQRNNCEQPDIGQDSRCVRESLWVGSSHLIENLFPTWSKLGTREDLMHT